MFKRLKHNGKWFLGAVLAIVYLASAGVRADTITSPAAPGPDYLKLISENTYAIMNVVNSIPNYLSQMAAIWLIQDSSQATADLQKSFTDYTNAISTSQNAQNSLQPKILASIFNSSTKNPSLTPNDLSFQTMIGMPYTNPDPRSGVDPAYNYLINATGLNLKHTTPVDDWRGCEPDKDAYKAYYGAVSSMQTFNSYVMSKVYSDTMGGNVVQKAQNDLITKATSPDWFSTVASEPISSVIRQLLMFNSQMFVSLTQIAEGQQKLLVGQSMANTMMILSGAGGEALMLVKAKKPLPGQTCPAPTDTSESSS